MTHQVTAKTLLAALLLFSSPGIPQAPGPDSDRLPRARWLQQGIIDAGGDHEPYTFVVRRGGQRLDALQHYQHAQSEGVIRRLKEQGVEVFHTHLYKGGGMAHEKAEMEDAKRAAAVAHRYGLKVDSYIQWNTMMYETFFAEEPRAKDWVQRDSLGRPLLLTYGYQQSFRYRPCFANQEYLDYLKKIVRYAIEEVRTDFLHFDNFDLSPEPDSCHCDRCTGGFRSYLKAKYTPERRRERFGFDNVNFVSPPQWNAQNRPEEMDIISDPGIQEWIDYRCQLMTDALRQIGLFAKSLNPEVAVEVNPNGITEGNCPWWRGLDHARFLKWAEVFWTEEERPPAYLPDGRLISQIRGYKLARAFDNVLFNFSSFDALSMAECLAFNQTVGLAGYDPLPAGARQYIAFYRKHRDLFVGTKDVANVAVLRSYPSITYNYPRAGLSALLMEQALIQTRIPFDLIFDEHLAGLSRYRVVVLPDSECLSDSQLAALRHFVEQGGGLVVTGQSGVYDEWRRIRVTPGLQDFVGRQPRSASSARKEYGQGRVAYFPSIEFDGPLPPAQPYFKLIDEFWKLPRNWKEITAGIRWAAKDEIPVQVSGPLFLVANLVSQADKHRVMVHLVNYNARNVSSVGPIQVSCRLPDQVAATEVRIYSPDAETSVAVPVQNTAGAASFVLPDVRTYSIAAVSW